MWNRRVQRSPDGRPPLDVQRGTFIYKLHGAFDMLDSDGDERDSLVIAEEDYLALLALLEHPQTTRYRKFKRPFPPIASLPPCPPVALPLVRPYPPTLPTALPQPRQRAAAPLREWMKA